MTVDDLPRVNAALNGAATALLVTGYVLIRRKKYAAHGATMGAAFVVSAVFLVFYLTHKFYRPDIRVAQRFPNLPDAWRYFYWFAVLIPHLILAIAMLPMIALAFARAYMRDWAGHVRVTRWAIWVWLYVSVTGVLIYMLLYHWFPALNARYASA